MTSDDTEKVNQHRNKVGGSLYSFQPSVMAHYFYSGSTQSGSLRNGAQGWQYLFSGAGTRNDMFGRLSTRHLIDAIYGPRSGLALARYQETIMTRNLATTIDQENTVSEERAKAEGEYLRYWREEFERGRASRLSNPNWTTDGWARP
jgi:hypothetical protein